VVYLRRLSSACQEIRRKVPEVALSADVIVGFPGETEDAFENSVRLLREQGFSRVHAFRFSVRPGTPAERLPKQVDPRLRAERTRRLVKVDTELRMAYAQRFIGRPVLALLESSGEGYTERYVRVRTVEPALQDGLRVLTPKAILPDATLVA
jgi:threonylcarbamoyladenosine tRNA methylthiotransferase MtaB